MPTSSRKESLVWRRKVSQVGLVDHLGQGPRLLRPCSPRTQLGAWPRSAGILMMVNSSQNTMVATAAMCSGLKNQRPASEGCLVGRRGNWPTANSSRERALLVTGVPRCHLTVREAIPLLVGEVLESPTNSSPRMWERSSAQRL